MDDSPLVPTPQRPLLSANYRRLNAELHRTEPSYGTSGRKYVEVIRQLVRDYDARHILDYGCGKKDLWNSLGREFDVRNFDPALPGLDAAPDPADLVACLDVLEHVEPDYLANVLADLVRVTIKVALLTIATRPSGKQLADGTNCHRILEKTDWWVERLGEHFHIAKVHLLSADNGLQVVAEPKK